MSLVFRLARHTWPAVTALAAFGVVAGITAAAPASASPRPTSGQVSYRHACAAPSPGHAACLAVVDSTATGRPLSSAQAAAAGLHPYLAADLQSAYKLPSALLGERQTIAIVDAYDNPDAARDLAKYRAANHLPACNAAFPCFAKVNQNGQHGHYPLANASWAVEESLDVDMASAICPNCHIILVEANKPTFASLASAEDEAAKLGADVISNSWAGQEYHGEQAACTSFDHPGIAITAAGGDSGFGVGFPAACSTVTAVGGTTLYQNNSKRGWAETAWSYDPNTGSGTGSGCSAYIAKPSWQHDKLCGMRTDNDTAAVADPATPVAVYDTTGEPGWMAVGGTSVATPLIGGVYALAGNTAIIGTGASHIYTHHQDLFDVTAGSNASPGSGCGGSYLCTATKGYDGPTGWGTPDGIGAF